jgi:Ca-activated chloride channel homolog
MGMTETTGRHRSRIAGAVALLTTAIVLAGCSAGSNTPASAPAHGSAPRNGGAAPVYGPEAGGGGANGAGPAMDSGGKALRERVPARSFEPEIDPAETPQSTFAVDVDTASYGYARSLIEQGRRPDPSSVRPEEFINAFPQDYPQPDGDGFSVTLDGARMPTWYATTGVADMRIMRVGLQTRADDRGERPDAALTFVIDTSGSMGEPGKLDMVKQALHALIDRLRPTDSVAVVTFNSEATVQRSMTPVSQRSTLHKVVDRLHAGGSTYLEDGLVKGYRVARDGFRPGATNRVVLLSDGLANVGDTQAAPILDRVSEEAAKQITLLGVGVGNDYGDALMEQLADKGDGFVVYVSKVDQAEEVFTQQLPATVELRALDAKVQVTFNPQTVSRYRLIGYDNRLLNASDFRDDRVDGGEVAAGYTVTALYAVRLRDDGDLGGGSMVAQAQVRWQDPTTRQPGEVGQAITVGDLETPFTSAPATLRTCYAAGYFAELLRGNPYVQGMRMPDLAAAAEAAGEPEATDLARVIRAAARLD